MVFIHYCDDNANKVIRLQLFLMEYEIDCMVVEKDDTVVDLLVKKAIGRLGLFISEPKNDNEWQMGDERLLAGSIKNTVSKIPTVKEKETGDVMKYFGCIGAIANADQTKLKKYFKSRQKKTIYEFFN